MLNRAVASKRGLVLRRTVLVEMVCTFSAEKNLL
jgi:hypothetical protein